MGRGSYVGDALMGLRMLGGLLSVPAVNAAQENADWQAQRLMAQAQGQSPPEQPEPAFFSTNNTGALGGLMSGIGGVGKFMAALSGAPVQAPRLDLGEQVSALQYGAQQAQRRAQAEAADVFTNPDAQKFAKAGQWDLAKNLQYPATAKGATSTNALRLQYNRLKRTDPQSPELPILAETISQIEAQQQRTAPRMDVHTNNIVNNTQAMEGAKNDALKAAVQTRGVYEDVFPMAQQASRALSDSVFAAKTGWQAVELGFKSAMGDEDANAAMKSITNAIRLARTVDVGNLNENERRIWEPFVDGRFQTKAEFDAGLRILDKQLRRRLQTQLSVLDAQSWPEMRKGLDLPEGMSGAEPSPQSDAWHGVLDNLGIPR